MQDHKYFGEATADSEDQEPRLAPIRPALEELTALTREFISEKYSPVADVSNYLLFVPSPPGGKGIPLNKENKISLVSRICG